MVDSCVLEEEKERETGQRGGEKRLKKKPLFPLGFFLHALNLRAWFSPIETFLLLSFPPQQRRTFRTLSARRGRRRFVATAQGKKEAAKNKGARQHPSMLFFSPSLLSLSSLLLSPHLVVVELALHKPQHERALSRAHVPEEDELRLLQLGGEQRGRGSHLRKDRSFRERVFFSVVASRSTRSLCERERHAAAAVVVIHALVETARDTGLEE